MQGRKLTKICGLVSAWAFVFLMVMPSVIAASPSIEKVDVDFNGVDITITIEGIDFTDELTATLGTDPTPFDLTFISANQLQLIVRRADFPNADYLLTLGPAAFLCGDGRPTALVFKYNGACSSTPVKHGQGDKASCDDVGIYSGFDAVNIKGAKTKSKKGEFIVTPSTGLVPGDPITIETLKGGRLPATSRFDISVGDALVQVVEIHTSCSQPLGANDSFGSLTLLSGAAANAEGVADYDLTIDDSEGGATGPPGADGADGAPGAPGADGAIGLIGPAGPTGSIGPAGPTGSTGLTGPAGPAGPAGSDGSDGSTGPAGSAGSAGLAGPPGLAGPAGPAGPPGSGGPGGGVTYITVKTGPFSADELTERVALCNPGDAVTGGGYELLGVSIALPVTSRPELDSAIQRFGWLVVMDSFPFLVPAPTPGAGGAFRVYAVCAHNP